MALFSNLVSLLFFTTLLLLSLQIHARDSQFFSKVTHTIINNNNGGKETDLIPNKKEELVMMNNKPDQQDQPVFIPEIDNNYGLYGHDSSSSSSSSSGHFPPAATTTTYRPYKTESEEYTSKYPNNKYSYYNRDQNDFLGNNNYYKDAYGNDLMRKENQKMYNSNNGGGYVRYGYNNGDERPRMSETRLMGGDDDGKYYYRNTNSMEGYYRTADGFQP